MYMKVFSPKLVYSARDIIVSDQQTKKFSMSDLIATHTDCTDICEVEETLLYEVAAEDYDTYPVSADMAEFMLWNIDGAKLEMFFPEVDGCTMYLSNNRAGTIECLFIKVDRAGCRVYELKPKGGELVED